MVPSGANDEGWAHSGRHQAVEISFQRKPVDSMKVDVPEADGRDVSENVVGGNRLAGSASSLDDLMQFPGIVGDHGVGQQRERAGNQHLLVSPATPIGSNRSGMDDALELMHRLPAH